MHDDTHQLDSSLMCSMFSPDFRDSSGTYPGTTARTVPGPLQRSACFECGLQGDRGIQVIKMLLQILFHGIVIEFTYRSLEFQPF